MTYRVGFGMDAHRFESNRKLMLGGVEIPHDRGLHGHSDADVLLHAIVDALLGAAGLGDIGMHFPDSDPRWKNAPSSVFVTSALERIHGAGWKIANVDLTLIAQEPKLSPYRDAILASVSSLLGVDRELVNLKATTTDSMGFIGRKEGIAAQAVVLLVH